MPFNPFYRSRPPAPFTGYGSGTGGFTYPPRPVTGTGTLYGVPFGATAGVGRMSGGTMYGPPIPAGGGATGSINPVGWGTRDYGTGAMGFQGPSVSPAGFAPLGAASQMPAPTTSGTLADLMRQFAGRRRGWTP